MLQDKMKTIAAETQQIKQDLHDAIIAQTPADKDNGRGFWFIIIKSSELENNIWLPEYYMTGRQLRRLSDYVIASSERSLETIYRTFQSVVKDGKSPAFKNVLFNKTARAVIKALL